MSHVHARMYTYYEWWKPAMCAAVTPTCMHVFIVSTGWVKVVEKRDPSRAPREDVAVGEGRERRHKKSNCSCGLDRETCR